MKPRYPVLLPLFACALAPIAALLMTAWRDATLAETGTAAFDWPVWSLGRPPREQVFDPVEISAAVVFCGVAWMFERMIWRDPGSRAFWLLWLPLFLSGLALVTMGRLHTGFAAIIGLALISRAYEWKRHRKHARKARGFSPSPDEAEGE